MKKAVMKITSRGELVDLINKSAVETYVVKSEPGVKIMNTIIYDKKKDKHYRIKWGEISDKNGTHHLWYEEKAVPVFLNRSLKQNGWCAKDEFNEVEEGVDLREHEFYRVEKNIIDPIIDNSYNLENVTLWGTKAGQGKTQYALSKTAEKMIEGKTILYFSTDESAKDVVRRLKKILEDLGENVEEIFARSNVKVYDGYEIDSNYIIKKMKEESQQGQLDFVVIDHLYLNPTGIGNNYKKVVEIHNEMDKWAVQLGCEVLITTQLNAGF